MVFVFQDTWSPVNSGCTCVAPSTKAFHENHMMWSESGLQLQLESELGPESEPELELEKEVESELKLELELIQKLLPHPCPLRGPQVGGSAM